MVAKRGIDNGKTDINENQDRWTCIETVINEGYQNHIVPESAATLDIETVHALSKLVLIRCKVMQTNNIYKSKKFIQEVNLYCIETVFCNIWTVICMYDVCSHGSVCWQFGCSKFRKGGLGEPCILSFIGQKYLGKTLFPNSNAVSLRDGKTDWDPKEARWIQEFHFRHADPSDELCDLPQSACKKSADKHIVGPFWIFWFLHVSK